VVIPGGHLGVVAQYRPSVTSNKATSFQNSTVMSMALFAHHGAYSGLNPIEMRLTVHFKAGATARDRASVAAVMRRSGLFDWVRVIP
jgi:hypothetical protein